MRLREISVIDKMSAGEEIVWINPGLIPFAHVKDSLESSMEDMRDAEARLARFAPFIRKMFPETEATCGIIESPLREIPQMKARLEEKSGKPFPGKWMLKMDSHLAVSGSIKARGGFYEVLKHAEDLAFAAGLLKESDDYSMLAEESFQQFFSGYTVQVGSTGNLGMSIGIMSAALGFEVVVHMSADAKQWKKDLLRSHGVIVKEYEGDYGEAVKNGRKLSDANPKSYFVDDENSRNLFLGYAVAALRLKNQLEEQKILVDEEHPLFVYLPCGVGGAPGGITFGLKQVFGDAVHCFFAEPTQAPCMALGMITGKNQDICVQDIGLSGKTHADGLAVGRPSGFVGLVMKHLLSGEVTVQDARLYDYMRDLLDSEDIFLEPSACAGFHGPVRLFQSGEGLLYVRDQELFDVIGESTHILWATGGSLVPEVMREEYKDTYL